MTESVLTVIEWNDAYSPTDGPWVSTGACSEGCDGPLPIITVGFVFKETHQFVALAASAALADLQKDLLDAEANVSGVMFIPQTQIRKRFEIDVLPKAAATAVNQWVCKGYDRPRP